MKTKRILMWIGLIVLITTASYLWGISFNNIYCDGAKTFFLNNRLDDIKNTVWSAISEEFLWRFIPFIIISFVLSSIKYTSNKKKKYISCSIALVIIVLIQVQFGVAHYSRIYETEDWMFKHIMLQGSMGLLYAIEYNVTQHYSKEIFKIQLVYSHIIGLLSSFIIHATVNTMLIINMTF